MQANTRITTRQSRSTSGEQHVSEVPAECTDCSGTAAAGWATPAARSSQLCCHTLAAPGRCRSLPHPPNDTFPPPPPCQVCPPPTTYARLLADNLVGAAAAVGRQPARPHVCAVSRLQRVVGIAAVMPVRVGHAPLCAPPHGEASTDPGWHAKRTKSSNGRPPQRTQARGEKAERESRQRQREAMEKQKVSSCAHSSANLHNGAVPLRALPLLQPPPPLRH